MKGAGLLSIISDFEPVCLAPYELVDESSSSVPVSMTIGVFGVPTGFIVCLLCVYT